MTVVPVRNLYYLYAYAWNEFPLARESDAGVDPGPDGTALLAHVLIHGIRRQLRRGLERAYVAHEETLVGLRGRLDVAKTVAGSLLQRGRTISRFDELEYDALANRLLKAALRRCAVDEHLPRTMRTPARQLLRTLDLAGVGDVRPTRAAFGAVHFHRNNRRYRFLLNVAELLLEGRFPGEDGTAGPFTAVLRDETKLARLFEKFLLGFYRSEQETFTAAAERVAWDVEPADDLSRSLLPSMKTDIVLRSSDRTIVIDAKFYRQTFQRHFGRDTVRSDHLYQLFSYLGNVRRQSAASPGGILIYPTTQQHVTLRYRIAGHAITIATVDLTQGWHKIADRLLAIPTVDQL